MSTLNERLRGSGTTDLTNFKPLYLELWHNQMKMGFLKQIYMKALARWLWRQGITLRPRKTRHERATLWWFSLYYWPEENFPDALFYLLCKLLDL